MNPSETPRPVGRGSSGNPPNRFLHVLAEADYEQLEFDEEFLRELNRPKTRYLEDTSKSIISENDSPDIPFRYSLNPYRGCLHGCSYCYARPTHEYLGLGAGLDFETKIVVKKNAAVLFRDWLARPNYKCEPVMFSGVTDCYQPVERILQLTRQCLLVAQEADQPVAMITKNALVTRDKVVLGEMAAKNLARAAVSITSLDQSLTRVLEPACSAPNARLDAVRQLSSSGIPVHVMVAPIIPGLNDSEIPAILHAASEAGARSASYILVRLPLNVEPLFLEWLKTHRPSMAEKVESRLRNVRGGQLSQTEFGLRMRGSGAMADQISAMFALHLRRTGLDVKLPPLCTDLFQPPKDSHGQGTLF